jgi:hypothetical protein
MTWAQTGYLAVGWALGSWIANLEIGWWGVPVAAACGVVIGLTVRLWQRRFA